MGLMDSLAGGIESAAVGVSQVATEQIRSLIEQERQKALEEVRSSIRMRDDSTLRERGKADAAEERARITAEATKSAGARQGLMASDAGLDDANYRGDEGIGTNVQKGQAVPNTRDYMMAKGDYANVAADERAERTAADLKAERKEDNARADRQFNETVRQHDAAAGLRSIQIKTAQLAYDRAVEENKMPPAVKMAFEAKSKAYQANEAAISKAMAEGTYDPNSPGAKAISDKQSAIASEMENLVKNYIPKVEGSKPSGKIDLTQFDKGAKTGGNGAATKPTGQKVERGSGSNPQASIYGSTQARDARRDELERIVGDQGNSIKSRREAQAELDRMK